MTKALGLTPPKAARAALSLCGLNDYDPSPSKGLRGFGAKKALDVMPALREFFKRHAGEPFSMEKVHNRLVARLCENLVQLTGPMFVAEPEHTHTTRRSSWCPAPPPPCVTTFGSRTGASPPLQTTRTWRTASRAHSWSRRWVTA